MKREQPKKQPETVWWDSFDFGGHPCYVGVTELGVVDVSIGAKDDAAFAASVAKRVQQAELVHDPARLATIRAQIEAFHAGSREPFDVTFDLRGTAFQKSVWAAMLEIPYGETRSYLDIARRIGNQQAVRAVGGACGANPVPVLIPCHRVIGANGKLTGFTGGLHLKELLLGIEGHDVFRSS